MIRFIIGLILIIGGVGGIEQNTATVMQGLAICIVGLGFMVWAVPKISGASGWFR